MVVAGREVVERSSVPAAGAGVDDEPDAPGLPTPLLLVLAALSACITAQGGYYAGGQVITAGLLVAGLVAAARSRRLTRDDVTPGPVLAAGALATWAILTSLAFGGHPLPVVGLLAGVCAVSTICRGGSMADRDGVATALAGIGTLVALSGWVGVAWRVSPLALEDQGLWRAATTLTYANATAGLLVPLALLALGRHGARPSRSGAALLCVLLAGAGATLSRGGGLALLAGLACLLALVGPRRMAGSLVAPALGALVALAFLVPSMPAGSPARPALAAFGLVAGLGVAVTLDRAPARARTAAVILAAVALALLVTAGPLAGPRRSVAGARFTTTSDDRRSETSAALRLVSQRPLVGAGPGRATLFFSGSDGQALFARYAHNEYLQVLAELGVVGLALVVVFFGTVAAAVVAGRRAVADRHLWAGAVAGLVALGVHSAFDFLWHVPALPLTGALLVALTIPAPPTDKEHA